MKRLGLGIAFLLAAAAPRASAQQQSASSINNNFSLQKREAPARIVDLSWGQGYQRLRGGGLKRTGRVSLKGSIARAEAVYVPKSGDPGDYRLITELGLEAPLTKNGIGLKLSWTDKRDSRPACAELREEKQWLAALSLRY